jgi:hypothetical protein
VTTIFCVAARRRGVAFATRVVTDVLTVPRIAPVDQAVFRRALALSWRDFEDAVPEEWPNDARATAAERQRAQRLSSARARGR